MMWTYTIEITLNDTDAEWLDAAAGSQGVALYIRDLIAAQQERQHQLNQRHIAATLLGAEPPRIGLVL